MHDVFLCPQSCLTRMYLNKNYYYYILGNNGNYLSENDKSDGYFQRLSYCIGLYL